MNTWIMSCNPQVYDHAASFKRNGYIDWVGTNKFEDGDTVYIYEVTPPRGRGAIVYKAEVATADLPPEEKTDDRIFWSGGTYPKNYSTSKFSRLNLVEEKNDDMLSLQALKPLGFTPPQGHAHQLDKKPDLLSYIRSRF